MNCTRLTLKLRLACETRLENNTAAYMRLSMRVSDRDRLRYNIRFRYEETTTVKQEELWLNIINSG